jgi:hypothetical protein
MSRLRCRPPSTVVAYGVVVAGILAVALAIEGPNPDLLGGGSVLALATLGRWRALWVAWLFLVFVGAGSLVFLLVRWPSWWLAGAALVVHGTMLALLLARPTRLYARRGRPRLRRW